MNNIPSMPCLWIKARWARMLSNFTWSVVVIALLTHQCNGQDSVPTEGEVTASDNTGAGCVVHLPFEGDATPAIGSVNVALDGKPNFHPGLAGQALSIRSDDGAALLRCPVEQLAMDNQHDFSVQFWIRTTMPSSERGVVISTKDIPDNSLESQKMKGWVFSIANGTWAWNMGSGNRRISYDRSNGEFLRINDGRWHQLAMTHDSINGLIRLYFDGKNLVTYNIKDSGRFEFGNDNPLSIGWNGKAPTHAATELPAFLAGAKQLQAMVNEFDSFGLPPVKPGELQMLVSRPTRLLAAKIEQLSQQEGAENNALIEKAKSLDLQNIIAISKRLMRSPYTVHQSSYYNEVALLFQLYSLKDGKITINERAAQRLAKREVLSRPSFDLDNLKLWNRQISPEEVLATYTRYFQSPKVLQPESLKTLVAGSWNIYHGGLHHSTERDGWDSRQAVIDLIKREKIDVLMMQETYSSGDYVAAELGYYFATTIDWDNMHQGANISVLSRFPIKEVYVPPKSTFMNVGTKVSLSQTQDIYVMSSWFGMRNFEDVFQYQKSRFDESDAIPTIIAGDFNAVPESDGGNNLGARMLLDYGFVDAYRNLYPDVKQHPGLTHRSNRRIDQLYYKGKGLKNIATEVFSSWPSKFPSDHYLLKSVFELNYSIR